MDFINKPCKHCPFRIDVKPFLHPDRAEEIAYSTQNPYANFPCHKTIEHDEDSGEGFEVESSKTCAGFLTMRAQQGEEIPDGFEPDWEGCYTEPFEMSDAYREEWEK